MDTVHNEQITRYLCHSNAPSASFCMEIEKGKLNLCPIPRCTGSANESYSMRRHFAYHHRREEISIVGEELERCPKCDMFVQDALAHSFTLTCKKLQNCRRNEKMAARQVMADSVKFYIDGGEIEWVREFEYLGRILSEDDDDTRCIEMNLKKARARWRSVSQVLKR